MAFSAVRKTVTTAAAAIDTADDTADGVYGESIMVRNSDASASAFLGGPAVTAAAGFELIAGATVTVDVSSSDRLYAITASGTVVLHVLEVGV